MVPQKSAGFTLIELMVVIAVLYALAILIFPALSRAKHPACRATCANNLRQIGTALNLYESVPAYDCFPIDSTTSPDPMRSMGILYRDYVGDARVFSCPLHPTIVSLMNLKPGSKDASAGNLTASMSGYGFDPGYGPVNGKIVPHNSGDSLAIVAADILHGSLPPMNGISANHKGIGVNALLCSGSVEWRELGTGKTISNNCGLDDATSGATQIIDPDIYTGGGITVPTSLNLESNVRP